ncbi:MAG: TMEM198/TM7SF3 family protein [Acidobacteria bacterium]|nr:MAG: TMEM198/TM7SF3 family protein [Acidobacteriota bacterium]
MLFAPSQIPVAIMLLAAGLLSCFMGYRLFRWLLGIYGFVGGAYLTSLFVDALEPWAAAATIVGGGLAGAVFLLLVYLAGVAILGAGLGVLAVSLFWTPPTGDPEWWVVVGACLVGAIAAVSLQRYVIIVSTSFGGAWTALVGALALGGDAEALAAAGGDLWQVYPMAPANGQVAFAIGWFGLGLLAALVQLRATSSARTRRKMGDK